MNKKFKGHQISSLVILICYIFIKRTLHKKDNKRKIPSSNRIKIMKTSVENFLKPLQSHASLIHKIDQRSQGYQSSRDLKTQR